jgi:hypothetical protein
MYICLPVYGLFMTFGTRLRCPQWSVKDWNLNSEVYIYIYIYVCVISHHSSREHWALTKFRHLTRLLASSLTSFHVLPWCLISLRIVLRHVVRGLVPGDSILGLLLLCHLVVGEVCGPTTPTSSAEFLIQLAFAWLSPTVLGLMCGPARVFSVFYGSICWEVYVRADIFMWHLAFWASCYVLHIQCVVPKGLRCCEYVRRNVSWWHC